MTDGIELMGLMGFDWIRLDWMNWMRLDGMGLDWIGLDWMGWIGLDRIGLDGSGLIQLDLFRSGLD